MAVVSHVRSGNVIQKMGELLLAAAVLKQNRSHYSITATNADRIYLNRCVRLKSGFTVVEKHYLEGHSFR